MPAALLALLLMATPSAGQSVGPEDAASPSSDVAPTSRTDLSEIEAALVGRIDALLPAVRAAAERARETHHVQDSVARANTPGVETVELDVGPLTIVTFPDQAEDARRLFASELAEMGALASADDGPLQGLTVTFQWAPRISTIPTSEATQHVAARRLWGETTVRTRIRDVLGGEISRALPPMVQFWLGHRPVRTAEGVASPRRMVILDGSASSTACVGGSVDACWASFGLSGSETPITEWYLAGQVEALAVSRRMSSWLECVGSPDLSTEACYDDFLRSGRSWSAAIPFNQLLRADLVAFALALGGEGALDRFLAGWPEGADEPGVGVGSKAAAAGMTLAELGWEMRSHLASAAGVSEEELMGRWRERVLHAEPADGEGDEAPRMATGFWVLFFAALATRSTRWRLG